MSWPLLLVSPFDLHFDRCGMDDKNKCRMGFIVWSFCIACGGCSVLFRVESIDRLIFVSIIFDISIPISSNFILSVLFGNTQSRFGSGCT